MKARKGVLSYTAAAIAVVLLLTVAGLAAPAPAGTLIRNQARATYSDSNGSGYETLSNVVDTMVSLVPGVDISAGRVTASKPGGFIIFPHVVTNTGNGPDAISITSDYGGSFGYSFFIDVDGDGLIGPADTPLEDTDGDGVLDTGLLLQGQAISILMMVQVPSDAGLDTSESFEIAAISGNNVEVKEFATDTVEVDSAVPSLDLFGSPQFSYLGNEYEYSVSFGNSGDTSVEDAVLTVPLPSGVDFVSAEGGGSYDSSGRVITWALGSIPAGASGSFDVRVKVVSAGAGITYVMNRAILDADGTVLEDGEPTGLVTGAPATIVLVADPDLVLGDGFSTSLLTAYVYDILGNPVPDGTLVEFNTELGRFRDNARPYYVTTTSGGIATAILVSPLMSGFEQIINLVTVVAGTPETGQAFDYIEIIFAPGGIVGVVRDSVTGFPVSGVLIELLDAQGEPISSTVTDENGRYLLIAPAIGIYTVRIHIPGTQEAVELPVEVLALFGSISSTEGAILGTVYLDDAAGTESASASALQPLAFADVFLFKDGSLVSQTQSDAEGNYQFTGLAKGFYLIKAVSQDGYAGFRAENMDQDGEVILNAIIQMYEQGLVYDGETLVPIPDAEVSLYYATGPLAGQEVPLGTFAEFPPQSNPEHSDPSGRYIFFVPEGNYIAVSKAFGYIDASKGPFYIAGGAFNAYIPMEVLPSTAFMLTKESDKAVAAPGERIKFTLTWQNISGEALTGVVLTDMLPEGLEPDTDTISAPGQYDSYTRKITWSYGTISSSSEAVVETFYAEVLPAVEDGEEIVNRAALTDDSDNVAVASVGLLLARKPSITITKQASAAKAGTGDIVTYVIRVVNSDQGDTPMTAQDVRVVDTMPVGFAYLAGSTYLEGARAEDPEIDGRLVTWQLGDIAPGEARELVYKLSPGPGAASGDGINSAMLYGTGELGQPFEEGPATARVLISGPAFSNLGAIIGKLWHDRDDDGAQDAGEEPIAGAEVMLDDGMRAVTDSEGMYHFGQVKPGLRSVKVNPASVPYGMGLSPSLSDFRGAAYSKFVTVLPSGTSRADFALLRETAEEGLYLAMELSAPDFASIKDGTVEAEVSIKLTNNSGVALKGATLALAATSSSDSLKAEIDMPQSPVPDISPGETIVLKKKLHISGKPDESFASVLVAAAVQKATLAKAASSSMLAQGSAVIVAAPSDLPQAVQGYSILSPNGHAVSFIGHISIRTQAVIDVQTELRVNGKAVSEAQVGTYTKDGLKGITLLEYVNVQIEPGLNTIQLVYPLTGKVLATSYVLLPSSARRAVAVSVPSSDSKTVGAKVAAAALAVDENGLPAGPLSKISFAASGAAFFDTDIDPREAGHQQKPGDKGQFNLLLSVTNPDAGLALAYTVGKEAARLDLSQSFAKSSPGFAVGTLELAHNLADFAGSYTAGRMYYRREISGAVLTFRYDPSQGTGDGLFSDAGKDELYGIYGDKSISANAAPSSSPLYIKIQSKYLYAMWGDFQSAFEGLELSGLRAKLTGFAAEARTGGFLLTGYAAPIGQRMVTDRVAANGTSGYFLLSEYPAVLGSETVYALKVLYYDESVVIDRKLLLKGRDYQIDYTSATLLLVEPIPSFDEDGNRNLLEISYKVPDSSAEGLYWGARIRGKIGPLTIGASAAGEAAGSDDTVVGAELGLDFGEAFRISAEAAVSLDGSEYGGYAVRAGAKSRIGRIELKLEGTVTDGGFVSMGSNATMPKGANLLAGVALGSESDVILSLASLNSWKGTDYDYSSSNELKVGYKFKSPFGISIGTSVKYEFQQSGTDDAKGISADAFLELAPTKELSFKATAQLFRFGTVSDTDGDFSISASYKPGSKLALVLSYVTGEREEERYHTLMLSADLAVGGSGKVYGKLSLPFGGSVRGNMITAGYRDSFLLAPGLKLNVSAEGQTGLKLPEFFAPGSYRVAASAILDYTSAGGLRATAKQEVSYSSEGLTSLTSVAVSGDAADWLSVKAEASYYSGISPTREGLPLKAEAEAYAAIRPDGTAVTGLLKLQGKYYTGEIMGRQELAGLAIATTDWTVELGRYFSATAKAAYKMVAEGPVGETAAFAHTLLLQASGSLHILNGTYLEGYVRAIGFADAWKIGYSVQAVQRIFNNMSVALGYNSKDLSDADMPEGKPWNEGVFLKLMLKF